MRFVLNLLLIPFLVLTALVFTFDGWLKVLGPVRWVVRLALLPLYLVSFITALCVDDDDARDDSRVTPLHSAQLTFERGEWVDAGLLGNRFVLPSGGSLVFQPAKPHELEVEMQRALEKGFALEAGLRWGGLRVTRFFGGAPLLVFYAVSDGERCLTARFEGSPEEEPAADAFIASALPVGAVPPAREPIDAATLAGQPWTTETHRWVQ